MRRTQYMGSFPLVTCAVRTMHARDNVHAMHAKFWDPDAVGRAVRGLVEMTGASNAELARLAGVSPSQVSRWSKGQTRPGQEALVRLRAELAERAEVDADDVLVTLLRAAGYPVEENLDRASSGLDDDLTDDADARHIRALGLPEAETRLLLDLRKSQIQQLQGVIESMRKRNKGT